MGADFLWDVASPARPCRVAGVTMAGFRDRLGTPAGLQLIPHPAVTVVLTFGPGSITVDDGAGRLRRGSLAAGLGFGAVRLRHADDIECLQIRVSPVMARAVLGIGPADLEGTVATLDEMWGREAARLGDRLAELSSWEDRFALADAWLADRHNGRAPVDREVAWAWRTIVRSRGRARVERLAADVGWSRKRLWSRFQAQIGLPPKRAASLVRFDHAAHRLAEGQAAARVAADGGYTDQSHLHREVMAFTGLTPATVAAEPFLAVDPVAWPRRAVSPAAQPGRGVSPAAQPR
jgi:AraC-like DNA-binding protein